MMNRKIFLGALVILTLASFRIANAQPTGKIARIGILADSSSPQIEALRHGLWDLGYIEGQNLLIVHRYAGGKRDRIPEMVAELLALEIDVIVPIESMSSIVAKTVKRSPVVFGVSDDPVKAGLVASLAHPGGNATGTTVKQTGLTISPAVLARADRVIK